MDDDAYRFVKAFVAALRLRGEQIIVLRDDAHQQRFAPVFRTMEWDQHSVWVAFIPQPITGRHSALDEGLLQLAKEGYLTIRPPGYADLVLPESLARRVLNRYDEADRVLLYGYAAIFQDPDERLTPPELEHGSSTLRPVS